MRMYSDYSDHDRDRGSSSRILGQGGGRPAAPAPSWLAGSGTGVGEGPAAQSLAGLGAARHQASASLSASASPTSTPASSSGPRRYVGRASRQNQNRIAHPSPRLSPSVPRPQPLPLPSYLQQPQPPAEDRAAKRALPWSLKLVAAVTLVTLVGMGWRLVGIATPPVGQGDGVEATYASVSNMLAGRVHAGMETGMETGMGTARWWPLPAPWQGPLPADPSATLPVFTWITSAGMLYLNLGDWFGRVVAIFFSALAGLMLFALVRDLSGVRAGLYSLLLYSLAPLSVVLGQQFSPASLMLTAQSLAVLSMVRWYRTTSASRVQGSGRAFGLAVACGVFAALVDPGSVFLVVPAAYVALYGHGFSGRSEAGGRYYRSAPGSPPVSISAAWERSPYRVKLVGYASAVWGSVLVWWLLASRVQAQTPGLPGSGQTGAGDWSAGLLALLNGTTYVHLVGLMVEGVLGVAGLVLLLAGLLHGTRGTLRLFFHAWLLGALLHVLAGAHRIGVYDDALLPLLLPVCALVGTGAAWAGSLPARIWLAVVEQRRENEDEYAISPHTSWLFDLPEAHALEAPGGPWRMRPQAKPRLGKSIAQRSRHTFAVLRRTWMLTMGHLAVVGALALVALSGWQATYARLQPGGPAQDLYSAGLDVAATTPPDARLIVVGPGAPELFYAARRTGWAVPAPRFNIAVVQALQREGASFLLTVDQEWLGHHPDYMGLLTNYSVRKLAHNYILFDLNTRPADNDRLYFLETGHTLGGRFRRFWETHGGVSKLGYPISEELQEVSPEDGQMRTVQYFERAVLEYHPEYEGTPDAVMLAAVGRRVTAGRDFPRVAPFENTPDRVYFPQTGHSLKQEFLRFWLREGGLAMFGYPISEELPEISPADGKVYTVQYFERARFEWHPAQAGTPAQVQLGLIGKQALEMQKAQREQAGHR